MEYIFENAPSIKTKTKSTTRHRMYSVKSIIRCVPNTQIDANIVYNMTKIITHSWIRLRERCYTYLEHVCIVSRWGEEQVLLVVCMLKVTFDIPLRTNISINDYLAEIYC